MRQANAVSTSLVTPSPTDSARRLSAIACISGESRLMTHIVTEDGWISIRAERFQGQSTPVPPRLVVDETHARFEGFRMVP